jgi:squalene synthase HpnD
MPGSPGNAAPVGASITRKSGSNLALSFMCLSPEKRAAMSTFYAYCRVADDIVDQTDVSDDAKRKEIALWRDEIRACYLGTPSTELGKELADIIGRYLIPPTPLNDILDGVEMDITQHRYATFSDLRLYCYRVASAVGLVSINIFEYKNPLTRQYAEHLGMAFQLTNILRDVGHDLKAYGRIYLPQDEMKSFGVTQADFERGEMTPACARLFRLQHFRARHYFRAADRCIAPEDRENLQAALIMTEVYGDLLKKLRRHNFDMLKKPVKLSKPEKMLAILKAQRRAKKPVPVLRPRSTVAVLGGGFAGIATALKMAEEGHQVELFESKAYIGGRAHSYKEVKTGATLDNGQHILMGCYRHSLDLLEGLGVMDKLDCQETVAVPYMSEAKGRTELAAEPRLPAPFHLLAALFRFKELSFADRMAALWLGFLIRLGGTPTADETAQQWLQRWKQTPGIIRALWEPFCIAALNEPVASASAQLLYETMRRSLFGGKADAAVYTSRVGLSDLLMPEAELFLRSTGGSMHIGEGIRSVEFQDGKITSLETTKGTARSFDLYVSALPPAALASLLPQDSEWQKRIGGISSAPIISIQFFCDGPFLKDPFVGLLDSPVQWVFDRTSQWENREPGTWLYPAIISAAYNLNDSKPAEIADLAWKEIQRLIPDARTVKVKHHVVYRSRDATFAARPAIAALRPGARTPWPNLFLAGDWIDTGLPATIESAVASAGLAAEAADRAS